MSGADWSESMSLKVFSSELKKFRTEHSAPSPGSTTVNYSPLAKASPTFSIPLRAVEKSLFAQLLLFDTAQLSVTGANVIAPLLCNRMGMKVFEELLEQDAIMFVQWEPEPMMAHDGKQITAAFVGRVDDGGPIDIEKRIDQGFLLEHAGSPTHRNPSGGGEVALDVLAISRDADDPCGTVEGTEDRNRQEAPKTRC